MTQSIEFDYGEFDAEPDGDDIGALTSEYSRLDLIKRELKDALDAVKGSLNDLEGEILDEMEATGITSVDANGLNVHSRSQLWVTRPDGVDQEEACKALEEVGLDDYSRKRYHSGSLSSHFRDRYEEEIEAFEDGHRDDFPEPEDVIPDALQGVIGLTERTSVRTRKK